MNNNKNNGFKTAYMIIITVVTVGCIIAGTVIHAGGWFFRSSNFWKNFNWKSEYTVDAGDQVKVEETLSNFDKIDLSMSIGDITVKEGNSYSIYYKYPEKWAPKFSVENGELIVSNNDIKNVNFGLNSDNFNCELIITVPKGTRISDAEISNSMGETKIYDIDFDELTIDASMGEVTVDNCKADTLEIDNSMGDINVTRVDFDYMNLNLSMGSAKVKECNGNKFECDNSMGAVKYEGTIEKVNVSNSMGDIELETKSDWKGRLETSMGDVKVNGANQGDTCVR